MIFCMHQVAVACQDGLTTRSNTAHPPDQPEMATASASLMQHPDYCWRVKLMIECINDFRAL